MLGLYHRRCNRNQERLQKRGDTAPWLFLAEGHKGGRRSLKVEPPLLVQDEKGGFSPELQRIYRLTPNLSKQK